jgi:SAM-dependent methyltransferase
VDEPDDQVLEHHLLDQLGHRRISFWHRVRAQVVLDALQGTGPATVADIGAGAGVLGELLYRRRPDVTYRFLEPLDALAGPLADRFGATASLGCIADVGAADVVALLDVIEHVEDDRALLADVVEAMSPGSRLVVTVPALPALWSEWDRALGHHRRYTRPRLRACIRGLELDVDEVSYLFPEMVPPALVRRFLPRRESDDATDLPQLPAWLDSILYGVSSTTYRLRRWWPAGASLGLVARRRG